MSKTSHRFITNILAATAATKVERPDDSSDDTDAEELDGINQNLGGMDLVEETLKGMCKHNPEEGAKAMGRHAKAIRLGRALWESPPLEEEVASLIQERFFDDGSFPPMKDVKAATTCAKSQVEERPAPFPR